MKTGTIHPKQFLILTFLFSWMVWGAMIIFKPADQYFLPLLFLGAFGPAIIAVYLIHRYGNLEQKRDFWSRILSFRRIGAKWYFFIFLIFPLILLLGYTFLSFFGGSFPGLDGYFGGISGPWDFMYLLVFMVLGGPLAEEPGWRGYLLDPLQEKWGKLKASLVLGVIWTIWHLPLFFIAGTSQYQKGFGIAFWSWTLQLMVISVIMTWVYNHTNRSILGAVLLHLMANFAYPLNLDGTGEIVFSVVRILIIIPILLWWMRKPASKKMLSGSAF